MLKKFDTNKPEAATDDQIQKHLNKADNIFDKQLQSDWVKQAELFKGLRRHWVII